MMIADTPDSRAAKRTRLAALETAPSLSVDELQEKFALTSSDEKRMEIEETPETEAWFDGTIKIVQTGGGGKTSEGSKRKDAAMSGVQRKVAEVLNRSNPAEKDVTLSAF